jgi:addiction module HigA family antidote
MLNSERHKRARRKPVHAGVFFKRRFIDSFEGLNMTRTAKSLGVSRQHLINFCAGRTSCTPKMASRLAIATNTGVAFWLSMQALQDVWDAEKGMESLDVKVLSLSS